MNQLGSKLRGFFNTRLGFFVLAIVLFGRRHTGHINQNSIWASPVAFNI